jgi:DNA-binding transcriptional LysR family regulator
MHLGPPPSVSAAVASLEREFGTKLFHRVGRGIALTEGGKLLLDEALQGRPSWLTGLLDVANPKGSFPR